MSEKTSEFKLRTTDDLIGAGEWLFNSQHSGAIDAKSADALNTTLKGQTYLVATLPLKMAELYVRAQIKKIQLPNRLLSAIK